MFRSNTWTNKRVCHSRAHARKMHAHISMTVGTEYTSCSAANCCAEPSVASTPFKNRIPCMFSHICNTREDICHQNVGSMLCNSNAILPCATRCLQCCQCRPSALSILNSRSRSVPPQNAFYFQGVPAPIHVANLQMKIIDLSIVAMLLHAIQFHITFLAGRCRVADILHDI